MTLKLPMSRATEAMAFHPFRDLPFSLARIEAHPPAAELDLQALRHIFCLWLSYRHTLGHIHIPGHSLRKYDISVDRRSESVWFQEELLAVSSPPPTHCTCS